MNNHANNQISPQSVQNERSRVLLYACVIGILFGTTQSGCEGLQRRRVDVKQPSGADPTLDSRFGLTGDAQDPSERDKELGYGMWKQKPEPEGTSSPTDPDRRKPYR